MNIKIFIFVFLFIILLYPVNALKITVSPAHININTFIGQEACKKVYISSDKNIVTYIKDKWANYSKDISIKDYNLTADNFRINVTYPNEIKLNSKKSFDLCITPEKAGTYHGILLFTSVNELAGVAILIQLTVFEAERSYAFTTITGNMIKLNTKFEQENFGFVPILILSYCLLAIFFVVIIRKIV